MRAQLGTIWKCRYFWMSLVVMDLRTRYRRSILGVGWSLMNPLMMTFVFCAVFGAWFHNPDWRIYGPSFLAGLTIFDFVRASALSGCQTFFRNEAYIRQCPLPLAIYTLRTVLGAAVHFAIALAVVAAAVFVLRPGLTVPVLQNAWAIMPGLVLLFFLAWSISILASFATVYFQDTQQLLEVLFQIFFFLTPIMYPKEVLIERGLGILLHINPIYPFFQVIRTPILTGEFPMMLDYAQAGLMVMLFGTLAVGAISYLEKRLIFHL